MATLVSPGISVSVIDESNYASTGPSTVPFILMATAQDKTSSAGGIATYTTAANAGKLQLVASQKELLTNYGLPIFPMDSSGNRIFGSELAEYGLMAAHSTLGITNQAYVLRADIDLNQLTGSSSRPYGDPADGTLWLDTAITNWGIFTFTNDYNTSTPAPYFTHQTPMVISDATMLDNSGKPKTSLGTVGSFAVDVTHATNPIYQKAFDNSWNLVGSPAWQSKTPTIRGNTTAATLTSGDIFIINGVSCTVPTSGIGTSTSGAYADLVSLINGKTNLYGVTAAFAGGYFYLFANYLAQSTGPSGSADGKVTITNSSGTPLTAMFGTYTSGTNPSGGWRGPTGAPGVSYYSSPKLAFGAHYSPPQWKYTDAVYAPTGSVWIKRTSVNNGAQYYVYKWSTASESWVAQPAPAYTSGREAINSYDPTLGGLGIANGALYIQLNATANTYTTATSQVLEWIGDGGALSITGSTTPGSTAFTIGDSFTIQTSLIGSTARSSLYTVTLGGSDRSAAGMVSAILSANIPYITAEVDDLGHIVIGNTNGGNIYFKNATNTPLATMGIDTSTTNCYDNGSSEILATYWAPAYDGSILQQDTAPTTAPADGTLWYFNTPIEVDIMINNGTNWKGYHNVASDSRGYDLNARTNNSAGTDPLGPIISNLAPTTQVGGTALVYGDLWVSTADLENYPQIYRWQHKNQVDQWVLLDTTDTTTENGVLFADARWDTDGTTDPAIDAKPSITSLLVSDYVDLDAPDPTIYPRGILLFNTRRSSYNVKKYVANKFTSANYPLQSIPDVPATWESASGKQINNVPYFGRRAQRNVIVSALQEAVDMNTQVREDQINFNLLVCPGYPELLSNLAALNADRRYTGFILGDTPMGLASDTSTVNNYVTNANGSGASDEDGFANSDSFTAVFYPGAAYTNALDGIGQVVVPITHAILRMVVKSDQNSYPWFAPAGTNRGKIDNVSKIGYVNRTTGQFVSIGTNQGLRDLLYQNRVNPVAVFASEGILNYGNHTCQATATALDRINVARLINYLRYNLERLAKPLVFEPNDTTTRNQAKQAVQGLLNQIVAQRGIYDYLVVCDTTNNTPATIDRNELHIDIAIEPVKAVEFIYVPVRILNTGAISGTNANQGGLSNTSSAVKVGA